MAEEDLALVRDEARQHMDKSLRSLKADLQKVRTGRASTGLLDGIQVDYYGTPTQLKQLANMTVPDPRLIVLSPYDKGSIPAIEKAIQKSDLGLTPSNDGKVVRIPIPPLTEERRKELVKVVRKMGEDAKVALRSARRDANEMAKELQKEKQISEDDEKQALKKIQDATDRYVTMVDDVLKKKEAEIMEV